MNLSRAVTVLLLLASALPAPVTARTCLDYRSYAPGEAPLRAVVPVPGPVGDLAVLAGHAYVACGSDGLRIFELEDPDHPAEVGHLDFGGAGAVRIAALGCQAFVAIGGAVEVVDITSAPAPVPLRRLAAGQAVVDLDVTGQRLAAATADSTLVVWPVGPCTLPGAAAVVALPGAPRRVALAGNWGFVATSAGLAVVDLTAASAPALAARLDPEAAFAAVAVWGDSLVAACGSELRVYAPPGPSPTLVRRIPLATPGLDVAADGAEIHVLSGTTWTIHCTGFHQLRLPVGTGLLPAAATSVVLAGPGVFFAAGSAGLVEGWRQCAIDPPAAVSADGGTVRLRSAPNPANPRVHLYLEGSAAAGGTLAIFDLRGRCVAIVHRGALAGGMTVYAWDGRDPEGRPLPSGRYVARWQAMQEQAALGFLLLR